MNNSYQMSAPIPQPRDGESSLSGSEVDSHAHSAYSTRSRTSMFGSDVIHHTPKMTEMDDTVEKTFLPRRTRSFPLPYLAIFLLAVLSFLGSAIGPVTLFLFLDEAPLWAKVSFAAVSGLIALMSLPTWLTLLFWRPPIVRDVHFSPQPVDIILTTYREDLDEIAGTLAAIMNIRYQGVLTIFVLDDASRDDVASLCSEVNDAGKFPVVHVSRLTNKGKKGGNINNWLSNVDSDAEFFITLDCDMRPFPNICNALLSHYFSFDDVTQRKIGFLQSPQFYRNYRPGRDAYDVLLLHFIKTIMPCLDTLNTVPYIGTSALWKREAIVQAGGFIEIHATEDVVTGCQVHRTKNPYGENYISKYVPIPVAAGLSPRSLPELMDQRSRWNAGLVEMTLYHNLFLFSKGLRPMQRIAYFSTCGGWIANLLMYSAVVSGTLFANAYVIYTAVTGSVGSTTPLWSIGVTVSFLIPFIAWLLLPGCSMGARIRGVQMAFVYLPTQLVGLLYCMGLPVSIQAASDSNGERRWHRHFWMHGVVYFAVLGSGLAALVLQWSNGGRNFAPYLQVILLILAWTAALWPIVKSLKDYRSEEDPMWLELESGRNELIATPVFSSLDTTAIEQMKELLVKMVQRNGTGADLSVSSRMPQPLQSEPEGHV
jgi:cellulose synthase/poly-beta-1,6-N-acetylglucosamine synthase-like glycosyltransferase